MNKIDVEKLIDEVEKRPALWNMNSKDYNDRVLKRQSWDELCVLFGGEDMTEGEKKDLEVLLHKKWKNIRDSFARDLQARKRKSGSEGGPSKAPYMFSQQLQFLRDSIELRETSNSLQESLEEDFEDAGSSAAQTITPRKMGRMKLHPVKERMICSLESLNKKNSETAENDANRHFLLSLLPSLSSLPKLLNSKCRLEIMQIINKYEEFALMQNHQRPPYYKLPGYLDDTSNTRMKQNASHGPQTRQQYTGGQQLSSTINYISEDAISPDETSNVSNFSE